MGAHDFFRTLWKRGRALLRNGLYLDDCIPGDEITIVTLNSSYLLKVIDPEERRIEIKGSGERFASPTMVTVAGSGAIVKERPLYLGTGEETVSLSRIKKATLVKASFFGKNSRE